MSWSFDGHFKWANSPAAQTCGGHCPNLLFRSFVVAVVAYVRFLQFRTKNASPVTNCT